jgi:4,5-DOPA dioxygenase extradiol
MNDSMPVLFVGHGSPMNAIEETQWSLDWAALGSELSRPRAIVALSAHWWTQGTFVQASRRPATIHDFGGFPEELSGVMYPAPGDPDLAAEIAAGIGARVTVDWGLDHGTWSVLVHLFPGAEIPVIQVSMDAGATPAMHVELGRKLSKWREGGVLIMASGNVTHNLADAFGRMRRGDRSRCDWAERFDAAVARALGARDEAWLLTAHETPDGRLAHPTADHWFPLLCAYGASRPEEEASFPSEGLDLGSLSMRAVRWG